MDNKLGAVPTPNFAPKNTDNDLNLGRNQRNNRARSYGKDTRQEPVNVKYETKVNNKIQININTNGKDNNRKQYPKQTVDNQSNDIFGKIQNFFLP